MQTATFAPRLLRWFATHGRHDLPWQYHHKPTANIYAVWVSEIMLQQTQVGTVLGYFERFMQTFPTVEALALANWDEVATLWAGLGYYARAKNLHKGAKQVVKFIQATGDFPQTVHDWQTISGVGRSTAGAIVSMGVRGRGVICDGNVKRVLTRWAGIDGDITKSATDKTLWALAETLTPTQDSGKFAQAMMDLGATVCTRTKPRCQACPLLDDCTALKQGNPTAYPIKSKAPVKPHRHSLVFALIHHDRLLWLKQDDAQSTGIWQGLYTLPMMMIAHGQTDTPTTLAHAKAKHECLSNALPLSLSEHEIIRLLGDEVLHPTHTLKHTLTHFHWHLTLIPLKVDDDLYHTITQALNAISAKFVWQSDGQGLGLPKAMDKLLGVLKSA